MFWVGFTVGLMILPIMFYLAVWIHSYFGHTDAEGHCGNCNNRCRNERA
jgi:hypothetical protein